MTALKVFQKVINKVIMIDIDTIAPNENQPRTLFDEQELFCLAQSIKENGILQPLTVREVNNTYQRVSGERRLRAAKLLEMKSVPCIIIDVTDKQSAVLALIENLQRTDLSYFEEAVALKNLMVEWGITQIELGKRLGKSQSGIANKIRLLAFPDDIQKLIFANELNERQARALLKIQDKDKLIEAIGYISTHRLSSVQTENYIDAILKSSQGKKKIKFIVKDVRIFFNTVSNAVKIMNEAGINVSTQKIECDDYIQYVIKIPT
ncbi:MAG: ParB/RepB/Spo0J family partition protein [Oscillospiraceae bacterium]